MADEAAIVFDAVSKIFEQGGERVEALRDVSLQVDSGERLVVTGPSGSGKSTLLHVAAGLDLPSRGRVLLEGLDTAQVPAARRAVVRRERVGFVFQFFNLLPTLTALENVVLPLDLAGRERGPSRRRGEALLERMDLAHRRNHFPEQLSGGEMQRIAVARALVAEPAVVLADEPTGNLDSTAGGRVLDLLEEAAGDGRVLMLVTHDIAATRIATRHMVLDDGRLRPGAAP